MRLNFNNISFFINNVKAAQNVTSTTPEAVQNSLLPQNIQMEQFFTQALLQFLDSKQQALLLKDLFTVPKEIQEFLSLLTYGDASIENLNKLLQENSKNLELSILKEALQANSKELFDKLIKLSNFEQKETLKQFQALLEVVQSYVPSQKASANEIILNTILLYLPWAPLPQGQNVSISADENPENQDKETIESLVIHLTTINLGELTVFITLDKGLNVYIKSEKGGDETVQNVLNSLKEKINGTDKSISTAVSVPIADESEENKKIPQKNVKFLSATSVNPKILLISCLIVRFIFEEDEKISLVAARKNMI